MAFTFGPKAIPTCTLPVHVIYASPAILCTVTVLRLALPLLKRLRRVHVLLAPTNIGHRMLICRSLCYGNPIGLLLENGVKRNTPAPVREEQSTRPINHFAK